MLACLAARGGGLFAQESLPEVRATLVADNEAQRGGGIFVLSSIRVVVDEVTLRNNSATETATDAATVRARVRDRDRVKD